MDYSLPGPSVHGTFQAKIGVGCHFLLQNSMILAKKKKKTKKKKTYRIAEQIESLEIDSHINGKIMAKERTYNEKRILNPILQ